MVRLRIYLRDPSNRQITQVISYVNPDASNSALMNFVNKANSLTTNSVEEVMKIVDAFLDEDAPIYEDDTLITRGDLEGIFSGTFSPTYDDDPITESDLASILDGTYSPVEDDDSLSAGDFVFAA